MKVLKQIADKIKGMGVVAYSAALYLFVTINDWTSSLLNNSNPLLHEANPFARDEALHFVLRKGMVVDLFFGLGFAAIAYCLYKLIEPWNDRVARMAAGFLLVYQASNRLLEAVIPNYFYALHMYVAQPERSNILQKILGLD